MLDLSYLAQSTKADVQTFSGTSGTGGYLTWQRPRGVSMLNIIAIGAGSDGGSGAIGAAGSSAGGGGGGSGGVTSVLVPALSLPALMYVKAPTLAADGATIVSISPPGAAGATEILAIANAPIANGGAASGNTAGTGATGGVVVAINSMRLAGLGRYTVAAGQNGSSGGDSASNAVSTVLPTSGIMVTAGGGGGGTAGAGLPGNLAGDISGAGVFPTLSAGISSSAATTPATDGSAGIQPIPELLYFYGGSGGGATFGSATGAGLVAGKGGNGAYGCGGGGGGGGLTGSTQGTGGQGGPGLVIIIAW